VKNETDLESKPAETARERVMFLEAELVKARQQHEAELQAPIDAAKAALAAAQVSLATAYSEYHTVTGKLHPDKEVEAVVMPAKSKGGRTVNLTEVEQATIQQKLLKALEGRKTSDIGLGMSELLAKARVNLDDDRIKNLIRRISRGKDGVFRRHGDNSKTVYYLPG
jgi:hypothetical protein